MLSRRKSGKVALAPPVGSGAKPQPKNDFDKIEDQKYNFPAMLNRNNTNFCTLAMSVQSQNIMKKGGQLEAN